MASIPAAVSVVTAVPEASGPRQGTWTYDDYAALPDDGQRYEVIEGVLYMVPSPGELHQRSSTRFVGYLMMHIELTGLGRVYHAPFDVELNPITVVQPDVIVVLNQRTQIITPRGIQGGPDLVIEIASPSTATHDRSRKLRAYEQAGVREYWLADPFAHTIELLVLEGKHYRSRGLFQGPALVPSTVVPDLRVRVEQFFS